MLYAAGRRVIAGVEVDWKQTMKRLRDHKSKLNQETISHTATIFISGNEEYFDDIMKKAQASSDLRNNHKNNSLYVGISSDGKVVSPSTYIDKDKAQRNIELARFIIRDEIKLQGMVGKLENMEPTRLADISSVDLMTEEQHKELLRKLANQT
ncbi:AbiV family abortive infection protein [Shewanella sp. D64]|uniref:AbiV family abortive infection protein n=1 Tax=unclassified Shewanella TaxID=196818 RepID=UPI0022BA4189|nr:MULTISPECIES: AbiV family abortive infection protein [unclassified Shewanella]MEC4726836.1 AbiV family abortive infection protein [Shewanella sp. D64]MEC4739052.1 AbiV family abortive infection protein [Shewanella sp. E94]WBJ98062.1 AbiV family abortive infection protein [Shewanella sp. MTB7]